MLLSCPEWLMVAPHHAQLGLLMGLGFCLAFQRTKHVEHSFAGLLSPVPLFHTDVKWMQCSLLHWSPGGG